MPERVLQALAHKLLPILAAAAYFKPHMHLNACGTRPAPS
jgi:hypothetical protein